MRKPKTTDEFQAANCKLIARVQAGDTQAAEDIIKLNEGLVRAEVNRRMRWVSGAGIDRDDLIQAGRMGVMRAAQKFDLGRPEKFSTYAYIWIKQQVALEIERHERNMPIPQYAVVVRNQITARWREITDAHGDNPTYEQIADILDVPVKHVRWVREAPTSVSMQTVIGDEDLTLEGVIPDRAVNVEDEVLDDIEREDISAAIKDRLDILSPRQREAVIYRFGLDGGGERTYRATGELMGVSGQTALNYVENAIDKFRKDPGTVAIADGLYPTTLHKREDRPDSKREVQIEATEVAEMNAVQQLLEDAERELEDNKSGIEILRQKIAEAEADNEELEAGIRFLKRRAEKAGA